MSDYCDSRQPTLNRLYVKYCSPRGFCGGAVHVDSVSKTGVRTITEAARALGTDYTFTCKYGARHDWEQAAVLARHVAPPGQIYKL